MNRLCPVVLVIFMLARAAAPLLPAGPWSPSGYQCGSYYLFLPSDHAHSCTADAAFGEGARVANRLDFVHFRREKFTVDARGYRNLPSGRKPGIILFGSSFSLGLSLNDEDTLSAQLSRRLPNAVYNASNVLNRDFSAEPLTRAAASLNVHNGWVLLEVLNRSPYGYGPPPRSTRAPFQSVERRFKNPFALTRISSLLNMRLQNDVLLPNPDKFRFPEEELADGRHMLFYIDDKNFFLHPADPRPTAEAVEHLRDELARAGFKLAVVLVPTGYTVYYPLLRDAPGPDTGAAYMASLARQLSGAGVPAFNCLPLLRSAAEHTQVYWPDDAHWNPQGVETVANSLAPWLRSLTDAVQ